MDETKLNSKSNSGISNNKTERKSVRDRKDAKTISNVIKKRGVYVEKFSGIEPNRMEELSQGSNKKLLESVLSTLTKSSKATQWPGEKNIITLNKENAQQFRKNKLESKERTPIIVLKPNSAVNKTTVIPNCGVGKSLAKTKNPLKTPPQAKVKVAAKTAPTIPKTTVNRTTVAKYKTADVKTAMKIPENTSPNITHEYVARRVKRYLLRQASPDNTLISDKLKKPEENLYDIEAKSEDTLDDTEHDAKIYSLIEDYLENAINICCDNLSEISNTNLHIDEEVVKKLVIIESDDGNQRSLIYCPYTKNSSMTTVKTCVEDISKTLEKQRNRNVGKECMDEVKIKKDKIKSKRYSKNAKPIIITNKSNSLEPSKQKTRRKPAPVPNFVNRTDFLVQNIYNIQLNSHKLKTKKNYMVKGLKNPGSVSQKPQNFFETLSLILKNKNKTYKSLYPNMDLKQNLKNFANVKKIKYK